MLQVLCASIRETTEKLYQNIHKIPCSTGAKLQAGCNISSIHFLFTHHSVHSQCQMWRKDCYMCVCVWTIIPCPLRTLINTYCGTTLEPCSVLIQGSYFMQCNETFHDIVVVIVVLPFIQVPHVHYNCLLNFRLQLDVQFCSIIFVAYFKIRPYFWISSREWKFLKISFHLVVLYSCTCVHHLRYL